MKKLIKSASFTDIHFGRKANSTLHNQDCIDFIEWFCDNVNDDKDIDHINFLGDWNENRSALNIHTLNYSYKGAKMLDSLGLPIYFIIGNHDLYYKNSREVHSVIHHSEFNNFQIIDHPIVIENIGTTTGALLCPYLFHEEYPSLTKFLDIETWWGHFEFKGFIVTGYNITMPTGPNAEEFKGPRYIFSGHFHKRQAFEDSNVVYIGNAFPGDFGDAGDNERGLMTYNHESKEVLFSNWEDCPKYIKTKLTDLIDIDKDERGQILLPNSRVNCLADVPLEFDEQNFLKQKFMEEFDLRELNFEESPAVQIALSDTEAGIDWDNEELQTVDELVLVMLNNIKTKHIDNHLLVDIYKNIKGNTNVTN